jgi:hypothetical protein
MQSLPSDATGTRVALVPTTPIHVRPVCFRQQQRAGTYQVKVYWVFKDVEAPDDILVLDVAQEDDLHWQFAKGGVVDPAMLGDLVFDDEFDGDFTAFIPVPSCHHKAIPARAQLVLELVRFHEIWL